MIHIVRLAPFALLRYLPLVICSLAFTLLAWILSPALAAFSVLADRATLPGWLQWFSTTDDDLDGGQHQQPAIYPADVTGFGLWWQRTCWICRNPAMGFDGYVFGFEDAGYRVLWETTPGLDLSVPGSRYLSVMQAANGRRYFCWRTAWPLTRTRFVKQWFGWHYRALDGVNHTLCFQPFGIKKTP